MSAHSTFLKPSAIIEQTVPHVSLVILLIPSNYFILMLQINKAKLK